MRVLRWTLTAVFVVGLVAPAVAQQEPGMMEMSPEQRAMMEAWAKAATPGPEHARLAKFAGEWTFATRYWMAPGAPPQESTGTASSTMVLGGRYVAEKISGMMMDAPFEGMGWTGYDNVMKHYVGAWIDNMGTAIMTMKGSWDEASNTFTATGTFPDAMTGEMTTMRMVTRFEGDDRHVTDFFGLGPDGQEFKMMEITYTRK